MRFGAWSYVRRSAVLPVPRPSRTGSGGKSGEEQGASVREAQITRPANQAQERPPKPGKDPRAIQAHFARRLAPFGEAPQSGAGEERIKRRKNQNQDEAQDPDEASVASVPGSREFRATIQRPRRLGHPKPVSGGYARKRGFEAALRHIRFCASGAVGPSQLNQS